MQMTFRELARATPPEYSVLSWPGDRGAVLDGLASALVLAAEQLAASANRPLPGALLAVASSQPEHFVLARLLACHGARVRFFCSRPVVWNDGHASLFRALLDILERSHENLDCESLRDIAGGNFAAGPNFAIEQDLPGRDGHPLGGRCDAVFAYGMLGGDPAGASRVLAQLGGLLHGGGTLDLFGGLQESSVLDRVVQQGSLIGFVPQAAAQQDGWRVTMLWPGPDALAQPAEEDPLVWKRRVQELERQLAEETAQRWADRNRFAARLHRLRTQGPFGDVPWQKSLVQAWFRGGVEAYARDEVYPGEWMQRFEEFRALRWEPPDKGHQLPPAHWELVRTERGGRLIRIGVPNPLHVRTVLFPRPEAAVGIRSLWGWIRQGVQTVWFHEKDGWEQYDLLGYLASRTARWIGRRALLPLKRWIRAEPPRGGDRVMRWAMRFFKRLRPSLIFYPHSPQSSQAAWREWIAAADQQTHEAAADGQPRKVFHYIGGLHPGGAERQLCNLALCQRRRGIGARVLTVAPLEQNEAHYAGLLAEEKVPVQQACRKQLDPAAINSVPWRLLQSVPETVQDNVVCLIHELLADMPDVLHCWLDQPNVLGAIAGLMAGVPHIILSTRNSNPTNFPRICEDFFQPWYQFVSQSSRVHLIANSHSGAVSYAEWIGLPLERIHVVFNGVCFDHFTPPTPELRQQARQSFGLSAEDRVVCGVFRLAAEKQPELFLEVIRKVRTRVPRLRVLLAGVGDLEERVRQVVREHDMESCVQMLGRRSDVATVFLASDASLLTSTLEGCPNVALESQYLGVPMVATDGGGTSDALLHGITGFLAGVTDADGLADSLTRVLLDDELRQRLAAAGPEFVQERFGLEQMADQTLAVYEAARTPSRSAGRVLPSRRGPISSVA